MVDLSQISDEDLMAYKEGRVHDVSDDGLLAIKGVSGDKQINLPKPELTTGEVRALGAVDQIPFGTDAVAYLASQFYGRDTSLTPEQKRTIAKQWIEQAGPIASEEDSGAYMTGQLLGGLPVAMATPAKFLKGASVLSRAGKGAVAAGALGAIHGAGRGEGAERLPNAIEDAVTYAPFGAGGSVAVDALSAGGRAVAKRVIGPLASKASKIFNKVTGPDATLDINVQGGLGEIGDSLRQRAPKEMPLTDGVIPLTEGQATQNAQKQALEYGSQAGAFGEDAQKIALEAREIQSAKAKEALGGLAGSKYAEPVEALIETMKNAYSTAKKTTNKLYKQVGEMSVGKPLMIAKEYVQGTLVPTIDDWAKAGSNGRAWDLEREGMGNAKRLFDQTKSFFKGDNKKLSSLDFFRLEDWRSRVSQGIAGSKDAQERAFLGGMLSRFDAAMETLPREAIKGGDDAIVSAMQKARSARKMQGQLFEKSKLVKDIVANDSLTPEQLGNTLGSLGNKSGAYVKDVLSSAADSAQKEELRGIMRQSILGNVLNKSLAQEVSAKSTAQNIETLVSFDKLATNLGKLIDNKTLFSQIVPKQAEQEALKSIYRSARLIKSVKPGSKNYSNTAYTILSAIEKLSPSIKSANVGGFGVGSVLKSAGDAAAEKELKSSLAMVLDENAKAMQLPMQALGEKYGRNIFLGASTALKPERAATSDIPTITIYKKRGE